MKIAFLKEQHDNETRSAITASTLKYFLSLGVELVLEHDIAKKIFQNDDTLLQNGIKIETDRYKLLSDADIVLRVKKPGKDEIKMLKPGCLHISFFDPFNEPDLIQAAIKQKISVISMEMIPRITRAQKMDALSSQTNLAGYAAVILAASKLPAAFPMMMTAAGTIAPAMVFVVGVGVAGLQAIATAKRLGARVEAFDTRPVVEEQVQSLGAKFVKIDLGNTGQTAGGHAVALTPEQLSKQREEMRKVCARANVIITTAQLFGKKAPTLITKDMIQAMQPGSVIVDMAVASGGNVEGVVLNKEAYINDVLIIGEPNLPGRIAASASQMYSMNLYYLLESFWNKTNKQFDYRMDDEVLKACLIIRDGNLVKQL